MTDEDVVARVAKLMGTSVRRQVDRRSKKKGWKPVFAAILKGSRAVEMMREVLPYMGKRRTQQIRKAISCYRGDRRRKISDQQAQEILRRSRAGELMGHLAVEFGISYSLVKAIKYGVRRVAV